MEHRGVFREGFLGVNSLPFLGNFFNLLGVFKKKIPNTPTSPSIQKNFKTPPSNNFWIRPCLYSFQKKHPFKKWGGRMGGHSRAYSEVFFWKGFLNHNSQPSENAHVTHLIWKTLIKYIKEGDGGLIILNFKQKKFWICK